MPKGITRYLLSFWQFSHASLMSAIDNFSNDEDVQVHGDQLGADVEKSSLDNDSDPSFEGAGVKKPKTNKLILLVPVAFVLVVIGYIGYKSVESKSSSEDVGNASMPKLTVSKISQAPPSPAALVPLEAGKTQVESPVNDVPSSVAAQVAPVMDFPKSAPSVNAPPVLVELPNQGKSQKDFPQSAAQPLALVQGAASSSSAPSDALTAKPSVPTVASVPLVSAGQREADDSLQAIEKEIDSKQNALNQLRQYAISRGSLKLETCNGVNLSPKQAQLPSHNPRNQKIVKSPTASLPSLPVHKVVRESNVDLKAPISKLSGQRADFGVYAIVDGRAWLTSSGDKANYTVAVGEQLPDGSNVVSMTATDTRLEVKTTKGSIVSGDTKSTK